MASCTNSTSSKRLVLRWKATWSVSQSAMCSALREEMPGLSDMGAFLGSRGELDRDGGQAL